MKKIVIISILSFITLSFIFVLLILPIFTKINDSIDLGNNYRYIQDYPQSIIYHDKDEYEGVGKEIIAPIVLEYNYNKDFMIAKTKDLESNDTIYWIVNKSEMKIENYLDFNHFSKLLEERNINLKLKPK